MIEIYYFKTSADNLRHIFVSCYQSRSLSKRAVLHAENPQLPTSFRESFTYKEILLFHDILTIKSSYSTQNSSYSWIININDQGLLVAA